MNYKRNETTDLESIMSSKADVEFYNTLLADFKNQRERTRVGFMTFKSVKEL